MDAARDLVSRTLSACLLSGEPDLRERRKTKTIPAISPDPKIAPTTYNPPNNSHSSLLADGVGGGVGAGVVGAGEGAGVGAGVTGTAEK